MSKKQKIDKPNRTSGEDVYLNAVRPANEDSSTFFRKITKILQRFLLIAHRRVHKVETDETLDAINKSESIYYYGCGALAGGFIASGLDRGIYDSGNPSIQATDLSNDSGSVDSSMSDRKSS